MCLSLLLYSQELLGGALNCVAKETGQAHGGVQEPNLVGVPHVSQAQPEEVFLDQKSRHCTTQRVCSDIRCSCYEVTFWH